MYEALNRTLDKNSQLLLASSTETSGNTDIYKERVYLFLYRH